jgi:iron complex outermembrane receptor protein
MRSKILMRNLVSGFTMATMAVAAIGTAGTASAQTSRRHFNIPNETLAAAIIEISKQGDVVVTASSKLVSGRSSKAVTGTFTPKEAIDLMLEGSGLRARLMTGGGFILEALPSNSPLPATYGAEPDRDAQEIVVTAQKRSERILDVPIPVSVISATALIQQNKVRLQDYFDSIPGLNYTAGNRSEPMVSMRGISTSTYATPTVGITIDDVPFNASTASGNGSSIPDFNPSDLARVEALRGPQGTLYGASSLGGLLRFVTIDPTTAGFSGKAEVGIEAIENGSGLGYNARASLNIPVDESLAVRVSGYGRRDPGYIDIPAYLFDPNGHKDGVNRSTAYGGYFSALWAPVSSFSLKLGAFIQHRELDGQSVVSDLPGLGDLQQSTLRGTGSSAFDEQLFSATGKLALGPVNLTSVTGYGVRKARDVNDLSSILSFVSEDNFGVAGTPLLERRSLKKFSQELRAAIPIGPHIDWLVGGFFTHESSQTIQHVVAADPPTGKFVGDLYLSDAPYRYQEIAAFTDITVKLTSNFDVQIGGREARITQGSRPSTSTGVAFFGGNGTPVTIPGVSSKPSYVFTYLVTPRWRLSPDVMVYGRFASGYRPGGGGAASTAAPCVVFGFPCQYGPDRTYNYEIGAKGTAFDKLITFDLSAYDIEWKGIQISLLDPSSNFGYVDNGGSARSRGIEATLGVNPAAGLNIAGWFGYNDAHLTKDFPTSSNAYGRAGDPLAYATRYSGSVDIGQKFNLTDDVLASAGAKVSYVGKRTGNFQFSPVRQILPQYTKIDLRAGIALHDWSLDMALNNVTDKRGVLAEGIDLSPSSYINYIQPRTLSLTIGKNF